MNYQIIKSCERSVDQNAIRVLLVDSKLSSHRLVKNFLEANEIQTLTAYDRHSMSCHLTDDRVDIMVVDPKPVSNDGLDVLSEIRSRSDVPIIVAGDHHQGELYRIKALELGADDYLAKPFSLPELLARIRSLMRRVNSLKNQATRDLPALRKSSGYRFLGWHLDHRNRRLINPSGAGLTLTNGEFNLLVAFLERPQTTLSREQLLNATRLHEDIFDRSVDVQILRLRRRLQASSQPLDVIKTIRGRGYVFAAPVDAV